MTWFRKALILSHRYLGIVLSLVIVMWFATGIVMMYAGGMPRLTPELRLERLPPLELSRIQLTPSDALARVGRRHDRALSWRTRVERDWPAHGREAVTPRRQPHDEGVAHRADAAGDRELRSSSVTTRHR